MNPVLYISEDDDYFDVDNVFPGDVTHDPNMTSFLQHDGPNSPTVISWFYRKIIIKKGNIKFADIYIFLSTK